MRMLMYITIPHEPFNSLVRDGTVGEKIGAILEDAQPEAVYFTERDGLRSAVLVVNLDSPSQIPKLAEPWFLTFEADAEMRIAMTPEDLQSSGLDDLGKRWG